MSEQPAQKPNKQMVAIVAFTVTITALVVFAFLFEFIQTSINPPTTSEALTADTYMERVNGLLAIGDATRGDAVLQQYNCVACHRAGAANNVAPSFVGIAEAATTRRPPLTAAAYLYESITQPMAHVVEGYAPAMPANYNTRITDQELADMLAYLLSGNAQ
jgi:cytochrome c551/c552